MKMPTADELEKLGKIAYDAHRRRIVSEIKQAKQFVQDISNCHLDSHTLELADKPEPPLWEDIGFGEQWNWMGVANALYKHIMDENKWASITAQKSE